MKTAVVILNWNTKGFLQRFLPPLLASCGYRKEEDGGWTLPAQGGTEVVVADSASTDGSMEWLTEALPCVRRIPLPENYGFTGGYNRAFDKLEEWAAREGWQDGFRYFVLINSDIEVSPGWLEPLTAWMDSHPECAACGPKLHTMETAAPPRFEYAGAAGGFLDRLGYPFCRGRILSRTQTDEGQYDAPGGQPVFWSTGACLMVRTDAWRRLGGLDGRFFAHMEEIDLCWRMQLEGSSVCTVTDSCLRHVGGGTLPAGSPFKTRLNYRNSLWMLENNLAKTLALEEVRKRTERRRKNGTEEADLLQAARKARKKAARRIFLRKVLDGCSALVYLMGGKPALFQAVIQAHREARAQSQTPSAEAVAEWLRGAAGKREIRGIYPSWIILDALRYGKKVFDMVQRKMNGL